MVPDALDTDYENGVADVLAYLAGDSAQVERNVRMRGKKSGKLRQIDVAVTGNIFGSGTATMLVDCKRYSKPVDVNHVGTFTSLVEDVGADLGLLVTTLGISEAAQQFADNVRGVRLNVFSLEELAAWSPPGTVHFDFAVPPESYADAVRAARRAGFRVRPVDVEAWRGDSGAGFSAFRHFGVTSPSAEEQAHAAARLRSALTRAGIADPVGLGNGVVVTGGTPGHRWMQVTARGVPIGLNVLASSEDEIRDELDYLASSHMVELPREALDVIRPEHWPVTRIFQQW